MSALLESQFERRSTVQRPFYSILFENRNDEPTLAKEVPLFFRDLNLDQVVDAITGSKPTYDLNAYFYTPLTAADAVLYRQEIMHDLERPALCKVVTSFSKEMRSIRENQAKAARSSYEREKQRWVLDAADTYCSAVEQLLRGLGAHNPSARGLLSFRHYLTVYVSSARFVTLRQEARALREQLSNVRYTVLINGNEVTVRRYDSELHYSAIVKEAFARFEHGGTKENRINLPANSGMNHIEAQIVERVAVLFPEVFRMLASFCESHEAFCDESLTKFDREVQFYIAYLDYTEKFRNAGLSFCYPEISDTNKEVESESSFDLALADKLMRENQAVVCNDFYLRGRERIFVVTGPNQGGKTTFARTFGQLHYLARLGCPVPGTRAALFLCDKLFTHFERPETASTERGKLKEDLVKVHRILAEATTNSVVIANEMFSSTTLQDAVYLSKKIVGRIAKVGLLCVCVTFLDELAFLSEQTVSLVAQIAPNDPTLRTYKIERQPANGHAYAMALAAKYELTHERLKERIAQS